MLVLQIAAGFVLGVLLLRFWRQSLALAGVLAVLGAVVVLVLWADRDLPRSEVVIHVVGGVMLGGAAVQWVVGRIQARRNRAIIVDERDSRE